MQCVASVFSLLCRPALTLGQLSHPLRFCFHNVSVFPDLPSLPVMPWDHQIIGQVFTRHSGNPPWGALHP